MRENDSDHDGQPDEYVSPWAPRTDWGGESEVPPYYAASYPGYGAPAGPTAPGPADSPARDDTISFGNPPPAYGPPDWGNWNPGDGYGPPPPPRPGRAGRLGVYLLVAAIAASIGAGVTFALNHTVGSPSSGVSANENIPAQHNNAAGSGSDARLNQTRVENKVEPGLVDITSTLKYNSETAEGTGMIVSADGLVLTNNHVIDQSTSVVATLVDGGRTYRAKVLGYDASGDIALLKLEGARGLPTVSLGNSDQINVGTPVLALGNAEGRGGATPAPGIINGLNRSIRANDEGSGGTENLHNMLQTSAPIQQGDSGGALANNAGQIVGMITAANTSSGQAEGTTGFAIPINTAVSVARQIASGNASSTVYIGTPGFLGVILPQSSSPDPHQQASDEQQALQQNNGGGFGGGTGCIQNNSQLSPPARIAPVSTGVVITGEFCGTAINDAGLTPGDVITSVNGKAVSTPNSLRNLTANYHPGDTVSLGWADTSGGRHTSQVTLGAGPVR